ATTVTVDRVLVTRDDLPEEHIRELTRILFENRLDLTIRFALANAINRPTIDEGLNIPLHSGSQQFYTRDEPTFLQENAEPLTLVVTLLAMLASSLFALRSRFISTQKDRLDSYNYELLDIAELGRNTDDIAELKELKQDMYSMLERVVLALDKDALTEEGFQSFSLLWETVREILNERITEVQSEEHPVDLIEPKLKSHKKRTSKARKEHSSAA
ncbi:MAG: TAXI family TRAP transporter solute-binding subunit, partial [Pseudomonadota bacterium]